VENEVENADPEISGVLSEGEPSDSNTQIRKSNRLKEKPKLSYRDMIKNCVMNAQTLTGRAPISFDEINNRSDKEQWRAAIEDELNSHEINNTWSLVERPENKNIVDCKWIFTIKQNEFGRPVKYKARLVARGFTQEYLIDYDETFCPCG